MYYSIFFWKFFDKSILASETKEDIFLNLKYK